MGGKENFRNIGEGLAELKGQLRWESKESGVEIPRSVPDRSPASRHSFGLCA